MRTVTLEGELGMRDAPELARMLTAALPDGGAVIDLSSVRSVDSAILQVLIAGHRSSLKTGVPLGFVNPGHPAFREALVGHGMIAADGSALTPEHDFWTRAVTQSEGETA